MNINELLRELRRNILRDVSGAVSADEADLLWTDEALVNYINEGYYRFCQQTEYLHDATTPDTCAIVVVAGQSSYPLHQSVLRVLSAEYDGLVIPVNSTDFSHGDRQDTPGYTRVRKEAYPGIFAVVPDYELGRLQVTGTPTADDAGKTIDLRVTRLPLAKLTLDDGTSAPELPEHWHLDLLEWAAWRALRNHDVDAENMAKASAHKTRFREAVEDAKEEAKQRKFFRMGYTDSWRWN